ncbi:MAG: M23 family metallopeptidase [Deltaproteobacteria bacterium]|uniref:M23 family metallopeptidase n=1 Tax=Candidatus Zymogenus saltonus TaxID=2844893 RepID=A0A9D8PNS7_9DELT|nr:M23 family metallopeptidase [Candidatus Zymogenus saltonus]
MNRLKSLIHVLLGTTVVLVASGLLSPGPGHDPYSKAVNPTGLDVLFYVSESCAEEAAGESPASSDCAKWGSINGIDLTAPFASITTDELLAISLGSMHEDLVRDGLPWFGAVRDDFKRAPRKHQGLDFYGDDLMIRAMADGTVTVRENRKNAGYYVIISHGRGVETLYMHLKEAYGGPNRVRRGDVLGLTGISGNAVSPQLHLGIRVDGAYIDPVTPLKETEDSGITKLIAYYESLFETKTAARKHLVSAYLSRDTEIKRIETGRAIELLRSISYDEQVSAWLKRFTGE